MNETSNNSITDYIINGLKKAVTELEEFQVQVALGKAEAHDAYEEAKKKFNTVLHETEVKIANTKVNEALNELRALFQSLMVQLALGKAETRDVFEEQRKKISAVLHDLELFLSKNELAVELQETLHREILKFRIKLDIVKLRFELNKMEARDEFESRKKDFTAKLKEFEQKLRDKESQAGKSWEHLRDDVSSAYKQVKNMFA